MNRIVVVFFFLFYHCSAQSVEVTIKNGPIVGETVEILQQNVNQFLGIPYAKPPIGKLRFRRPVSVDQWIEPLKALDWPYNCPQVPQPFNAETGQHIEYNNKNFSEDCLYLNLWSPNVRIDEDHLRPVIVFIHGGALILGGSSFDLFNGNALSVLTDSVVVTINYRLSTLGFLYSDGTADVKGNQGLWDQSFALEWIQDNIRYFGGNPKQVTIMGNSAGSWSVTAHILSPVSRKLFKNAIMLSGASLASVVKSSDSMIKAYLSAIRKAGCATESTTSIDDQVIECLESLDSKIAGPLIFMSDTKFSDFPPMMTIDGEFLPLHPMEMLKTGNFKHDLNLLVSTVSDEGSFILNMQGQDSRFDSVKPSPITLEEAKKKLVQVTNEAIGTNVDEKTLLNLYFNGMTESDKPNLFRRQVGVAYGDFILACPTLYFAKKLFQSSQEKVKVYEWHYAVKIGKEKMLCGDWMGTCHCDELFPIFGMSFRYPLQYQSREREISLEMTSVLKSFIRTGDPGAEHKEWKNYFMSGDNVLAPYYQISNDIKSHNSYKFNLKHIECDTLWKHYIETI